MEHLLQYLWANRIVPLGQLTTTSGERLEIIDPGIINHDAGPDFFNAKIRINGIVWVGNVEIHTTSSMWKRHGHHHDKLYDSVILHVANEVDCSVTTTMGEPIPQFQLFCSNQMREQYQKLCYNKSFPRCAEIISTISSQEVTTWLDELSKKRINWRSEQIHQRMERHNLDWEVTCFVTLARSFGFGLNGDAFENWADTVNFKAASKHRNHLLQVEAIFLGQAGFLEASYPDDSYYIKLQSEYRYLKHKFALKQMEAERWRLLRIRPYNFPPLRIAQLAHLFAIRPSLLSHILDAKTVSELHDLFTVQSSPYWEDHFTFGRVVQDIDVPSNTQSDSQSDEKKKPKRKRKLTKQSLNLLIFNAVVPMLYAYGNAHANQAVVDRALKFLKEMKAEDNYIIRRWKEVGINIATASESQALIHLHKQYCERRRCLYCHFGFHYLKGSTLDKQENEILC